MFRVFPRDEMMYLMNSTTGFVPLKVNSKDYAISEFVVGLWTNFAATGLVIIFQVFYNSEKSFVFLLECHSMKTLMEQGLTSGNQLMTQKISNYLRLQRSLR
jgi:hypothetical protein